MQDLKLISKTDNFGNRDLDICLTADGNMRLCETNDELISQAISKNLISSLKNDYGVDLGNIKKYKIVELIISIFFLRLQRSLIVLSNIYGKEISLKSFSPKLSNSNLYLNLKFNVVSSISAGIEEIEHDIAF